MTRPRGFIDNWEPRPHVLELINNVQEIIEASDILPITLRQLFYILVSDHGYSKTQKDYKRLCETMNRARRARLISMDAIRDDELKRETAFSWDSGEQYVDTIKAWAGDFQLNRQADQAQKVYLWCEAGGMVPQLAKAVKPFHIPVISSGGFDSVTTKHNFAKEISKQGNVVILHLGDHDPSGVHMYYSLDEDLQAFVSDLGGSIDLKRIAVTPEQIEELRLPTAPAKSSDKRAFKGLTTQCEAIPPRVLREIVLKEVAVFIDDFILNETKDTEEIISADLLEKIKKGFGV